ncbi:MAG TPA: ATP-binding protein [Opitutaceae bacterium]|jgi:signal transduction histidine kinase/CheY-like chemotaxis protein
MPGDDGRQLAAWLHEILPYGIFTTDRDLRVTSWNDWLAVHSGVGSGAVVGQLLGDAFPELVRRNLVERYQRALKGEVSVLSAALHKYLLPFPSTAGDSTVDHMLQTVRIGPLPEGDGEPGTITIIEDVTQREAQAMALSRQQDFDRLLSEALARLLQASSPADEMAAIFGAVRLTTGLDAFAGYLISADGRSMRLHASAGLSPKHRRAIEELPVSTEDMAELAGPAPSGQLSVASRSREVLSFGMRHVWSFPLAVAGRVLGVVIFGSYVRDTIEPADIVVLGRVAQYMAIAIDRSRRERETEAASRAKDDFLAALSHELRTPLNPILLIASEGAADPALDERARAALHIVQKNALLEARLIDDLLDLTRIEHGKLGIDIRRLDLREVLEDAITVLTPSVEEAGLRLETSLLPFNTQVMGDPNRLQQLFWNIIKNAVKFTPRGGWISVSAEVGPERAVVRVTDSGIGMEPHELRRAFETFEQGDHAAGGRHRFGGLGLGLAITKKLAELHGATIEAESAGRDQGSTFTLSIPLAPAPVAAHEPATSARPPVPVIEGNSRRILVVEDHDATLKVLRRVLEKRGFLVTAVTSVAAAVEAAASGSFDLVLSDVGLPDGDGYSLMRRLKAEHGFRGVALTGYGTSEDRARAKAAGFVAQLTKPINIEMLTRVLASSLDPVAETAAG